MRSCPLLLLLAASPAAAYDLDSLRADSSFGLFRDEYDYLREPAMLASQSGRHLFTVLGNQGGGDRFSVGYLGGAGPGVLGVIGDFSSSVAGGSSTSASAPTAASGASVTAVTSASRVRKGGIFLGYGLSLSERLAVGVGAEVTDERWQTSLTPVPGGSPVVGGALTTVTVDGEEASREEGTYTAQDSRARALLGLERAGPKLDLEVDLFAERLRTRTQARASATTTTTAYTLAGYAPDVPLDENLTATLPGLAMDGAVALGSRASLRLYAEGAYGPAHPTLDAVDETWSDSSDPDAPVAWSAREVLSDDTMRLSAGQVLLALELDGDPVAVRFGASVAREGRSFSVSRSRVSVGDPATEGTVAERESLAEAYTVVALPVAVEVAASPRWTLRAGGQYVHAFLAYKAASTLTSPAGEGDVTAATRRDANQQSYVEMALGLRFDAAEAFSLDAVASGVGLPDQRTALDLGSLLVSGVFHLP